MSDEHKHTWLWSGSRWTPYTCDCGEEMTKEEADNRVNVWELLSKEYMNYLLSLDKLRKELE